MIDNFEIKGFFIDKVFRIELKIGEYSSTMILAESCLKDTKKEELIYKDELIRVVSNSISHLFCCYAKEELLRAADQEET